MHAQLTCDQRGLWQPEEQKQNDENHESSSMQLRKLLPPIMGLPAADCPDCPVLQHSLAKIPTLMLATSITIVWQLANENIVMYSVPAFLGCATSGFHMPYCK